MFVKHNDFELLYLLKNGSSKAEVMLYDKYTILLKKFYLKYGFYTRWCWDDFLQEGLLLLTTTLRSFSEKYNASFYIYFEMCLKRKVMRMQNYAKGLNLKETGTMYLSDLEYKDSNTFSMKKYIIEKTISSLDDESKQIATECILKGVSLKSYCNKYHLNYLSTKYIYNKLKKNLTKKVD